jgi:hypothetical protein
MPAIWIGVAEFVVVPVIAGLPQHHIEPKTMAQVNPLPADIADTLFKFGTTMGVADKVALPLACACPQQDTVPFDSSAQVWFQPMAIAATPLKPDTATGLVEHATRPGPHVLGPVLVPLPS